MNIWLGGTDESNEGRWKWFTTGQNVTADSYFWGSGQPNNYGGTEHCLENRDGKWNDAICDESRISACEFIIF